MGDEFTLEDLLIVLRRRALFFLVPFVVLSILAVAVVMLLPARYTAQGTILVESAQIPSDLVRSTINAYAQERIQVIRQRVMTREKLLQLVDKYAIFPKDSGLNASERVARMRQRLKVDLITTEGARTAQRDGTIAFTISYTDRSPETAFKVANEVMTMFLSEDVRARTAGASNTTEFFKQEVQRLATAVDSIEERIAAFKAENAKALPEYLKMHMDLLERATRDLAGFETQISMLDEEIRNTETQLATYFAGATTEGGPAQELARLKSELAQLRSVYRDAHPNVKAVRDQIRGLEAQLQPSKAIQNLQTKLKSARDDLKTAKETLPAGDPQIAEKQASIEALQGQLSDLVTREASSGGGDFMSSQLQGRIAVAQSRRDALTDQIDETRALVSDLAARIERTPEVERALQALTRDYDNVFKEYQEVLAKQQEAQLAENLEDDQKAERFSILEAAQSPEEPSSPERVKLSILGLFGAFAAGVAAAGGIELTSSTIRGRNHLTKISGAHPIAVIPHFRREPARRGRRSPAIAASPPEESFLKESA
jgi:uncharacterized protein involved in exopolysaccharide biosynthesis